MSIIVTNVERHIINTIPVKIDIAHSVSTAKGKNGWRNNKLICYSPLFHGDVYAPTSELHILTQQHQKVVYNILFRTSAEALKQLAQDPRYVGGEIGMVGVLHTWGRDLSYHPHVHYLVPAGGLSFDGEQWVSVKHNFLVPVKALSILFRAKFRDEVQKAGLIDEVSPSVWHKDWVTHSKPEFR